MECQGKFFADNIMISGSDQMPGVRPSRSTELLTALSFTTDHKKLTSGVLESNARAGKR
jgi:hypothetical protein